MFKDYLLIPLKEIRRRPLRSWLTLIGVIIGMAAVISLITLGNGLENAVAEQFAALGNDKLIISAKGSALTAGLSIDAVKITEKDHEIVKAVDGVKKTAGFVYSTANIEFNDRVRFFFIFGTPDDPEERLLIGETNSLKLLKGRVLDKGDKYKAVLGYDYLNSGLFDKALEVGDKILIKGQEFKVIGFWQKIGSPPDDRSITINLDTYADLFEIDDELGIIIAQTQPGEDPNLVAASIEKELRKSRGLKEGKEDFKVETPEQLAATFTIILDIIQVVLVGISIISLLVGGIGIMNTMYTVVLERTKQIGVLKALGAQNKHILYLFLVESGFYGLFGGLIGAIIGISFAKLVELFFTLFVGPSFLSIKISFTLILLTLIFSLSVGCLSGIAPARKAAKLNPVDSLRYE